MRRKEICWVHAVAGSFLGSLKIESFCSNYAAREEFKNDVPHYIEVCCNSHTGHSYLGDVSLKGFEKFLIPEKTVL